MTKSPPSSELNETAGFLGGLIRQARLGWRLLNDARVPGWVKMIPFAGLLYLLSPIDLLPDWVLGLGEVDDVVLLLLALKVFVDLSPPGIVREHVEDLLGRQGDPRPPADAEPYIDAPYRVLDQDQDQRSTS